MIIDWVGFIEAARCAGWWDYQTWDAMQEAFNDSNVWADLRPGIELRFKQYVLLKKHPMMLTSLQSPAIS